MAHLSTYLTLALETERRLAASFRTVGTGHADEADVFHTCELLASWSDEHVRQLEPLDRDEGLQERDRLHLDAIAAVRRTPVGLLRDLQDLHLIATLAQTTWTVVWDAAQAERDHDLMAVAQACNAETSRQLTWLVTRMKQAAPQALLVSS